jgi:hypothetical protein
VETSAKHNVNVEAAFRVIANAILTKIIDKEQAVGASSGDTQLNKPGKRKRWPGDITPLPLTRSS